MGFPVCPELLVPLLSASPSPYRLVELLQVMPQPLGVLSYRLFWYVYREAVHQPELSAEHNLAGGCTRCVVNAGPIGEEDSIEVGIPINRVVDRCLRQTVQ
ncbi:hypothetical protein T12_932 [Trichinella patagoniensis]|uniref:Uncharacterized protein n=1 Tax=Trichinella patagoniensis TaxID=990121 RepID=A0A0V0ZHG1_9BILA|nr:hypothetical protein T12_6923 [Trichinella patagoniensis]KRY13793.1 hypothetical protein T12_932 [Trichinella patagoniensis]